MEQSAWFVIKPEPGDIEHYGIMGQRHGRRRYQNQDGSLTPAGRIHYGYGPARQIGGPTENSDNGPTVEGRGTSRYERTTGPTRTASRRDYRDADDDTTTSGNTSQQSSGNNRQNNNNTSSNNSQQQSNGNNGQNNTSQQQRNRNNRQDNRNADTVDGTWESVGGRNGGGNNRPPGNDNSSGGSGSNNSGGNNGNGNSGGNNRSNNGKDPVAERLKNKSKLYGAEEDLTKDLSRILGNSVDKATQKKMAKMNLDYMSDDDLRNAINRYNLERQYKQIAVGDVATGRQRLQGTLEVAGSILAVGASAATIASIIHELKKG